MINELLVPLLEQSHNIRMKNRFIIELKNIHSEYDMLNCNDELYKLNH